MHGFDGSHFILNHIRTDALQDIYDGQHDLPLYCLYYVHLLSLAHFIPVRYNHQASPQLLHDADVGQSDDISQSDTAVLTISCISLSLHSFTNIWYLEGT